MKTKIENKKIPMSIKLIIIWMVFMVIRTITKLVSLSRFEINVEIFGQNVALFNYISDAIILITFVIFVVLFILRKRNSWKYFMILMGILMVGVIIGIFYAEKLLPNFIPIESSEVAGFVILFTYIIAFLIILFYGFLAYLVYKNRGYFEK